MIELPANRPHGRFYRGGERIARFRSEQGFAATHEPEDWVGSTTAVAGEAPQGMTVLPDGRFLADAVAADPVAWLGADHVAAFGPDTRLLVKLLDAGQRLPVHAHPDAGFAGEHLGRAHGKAEAWWILTPGVVHLGIREGIDPADLRDLVDEQRTDRLLGLLHAFAVVPGDVVYVPPGTLHAIGGGILLVEVQEPEDLSILLEWRGFDLDGEADGHLGIGFEAAIGAIDLAPRPREQVAALIRHPDRLGDDALPDEASPYFSFERVVGGEEFEPGFSIAVVTRGEGAFDAAGGESIGVRAGSTILIPAADGAIRVSGSAEAVVARPPRA
ncbi:class I mannose-6-phosphate isomerase [Microbacterium indicum]|uniref:class I mannose-6-phosphate isomerase n=1 Tax=Microbacterium indicum TaxID=358100 RepID=UPI00040F5B61|nr:class I mannose-6-phosphate isomerase [Microbacterium indicum]